MKRNSSGHISRCLPHSQSLARPGQRRASLAQHGGRAIYRRSPLEPIEGLCKVGPEVLDMLDANRHPHQAFWYRLEFAAPSSPAL